MSIRVMSQVWETSKATGTTLLVLLALADHSRDDGRCWPSMRRIAHYARISERQAQRHVQQLIELGELQLLKEGGGKGITNIYKVTPVTGYGAEDTPMDRGSQVTPFEPQTLSSSADTLSSSAAKGDIAMSPESLEPLLKATAGDIENKTSRDQTAWVMALAEAKRGMASRYFNQYLEPTWCQELSDERVVVAVADDEAQAWLADRMTSTMQNILTGILARRVDVVWEVASE